jgi:hypothetical protein
VAITDELWNALQSARESYFQAVEATNAALRDAPSGLPHPDGAFRIGKASRIQKMAHDIYLEALEKYTEALRNDRVRHSKF